MMDYRQFYDLESYLFNVVRERFQAQGWLGAFDFFCIVIWKANRAKTNIAKRLRKEIDTDLETACRKLTGNIAQRPDAKEKLHYLLTDAGFYLPMATAILTVLYPEDYTIYDFRVCESIKALKCTDYSKLGRGSRFDKVWTGYQGFIESVRTNTPANLSFREKDQYLWGKSFKEQLEEDIKKGFLKE